MFRNILWLGMLMEVLNVSYIMNGSIFFEWIDDLVYYVLNLLINKNWLKLDYGKW